MKTTAIVAVLSALVVTTQGNAIEFLQQHLSRELKKKRKQETFEVVDGFSLELFENTAPTPDTCGIPRSNRRLKKCPKPEFKVDGNKGKTQPENRRCEGMQYQNHCSCSEKCRIWGDPHIAPFFSKCSTVLNKIP